jgi:2-keto-4-pentenoate hydratase/2-oxohepta-3-ene-1,7-dioic acid hydratase in catechol pathway
VRWCSFTTTTGGPARLGAVHESPEPGDEPRVLDVGAWARSRDAETPADLVDLVTASPATQQRVVDLVRSATDSTPGWVRPEEVVYLAPLREAHAVRSLVSWGEPPVLAHGNRSALLGPGEVVPWPPYATGLSATCEIAAVVGVAGRDLAPGDALGHVFGFVVLNAWTVVGVDGAKARVATSLGQCVTTPDSFDPSAVAAAVITVDGVESATGDVARPWSFGDLLAAASAGEELRPTDVVSSGPLAGAVPVARGAVVEAVVPGLGAVAGTVG